MTRDRVDVAVIGTVGGVGATTLSVALAAVAARRGETVELAESPAALSYCANGRPTGMTWGDYGAPMDGCTVSLAVGDVPGDQVVVVVDASVHGVREARWALWRDVVIVVRTHDGSLTVETVAEVLGYRLDELIEWADRRSVRLANDAGIMATHTPASLVKVAELVLDRAMVEVDGGGGIVSADKFYVRIDRADGSRTYKGPWVHAHCYREMQAWQRTFLGYHCAIVEASDVDVRADVRRFDRATKVDRWGRQTKYRPDSAEVTK